MTSAARPAYVASVLTLYVDLPDTPSRASAQDHCQAGRLYTQGVPLSVVESALLLGTLRRLLRTPNLPQLNPIRSLAYFQPVIAELQQNPLPDGYLNYLRLKLRNAANPPDIQKNTFSGER